MEDSVRKAMEGFELPVNDQDWERISQALDSGRKRRGFWLFRKFLPLLILLILATGVAVWMLNDKTPMQQSVKTGHQPEHTAVHDNQVKDKRIEAKTEDREDRLNKTGSGSSSDPGNHNLANADQARVLNQLPADATIIAHDPVVAPASAQNGQTTAGDQPETGGTTNILQPSAALQISPFGIRAAILGLTAPQPAKIADVVPGLLHFPKDAPTLKTGWFAGMHLTAATQNTTDLRNTTRWTDNAGLLPMIGNSLGFNIRMDAGLYADLGGWRFSGGLGLEGNPIPSTQDRTATIRIAKRFLPYFDSRGTLLYWLAVEWKDSLIKYRQTQQQLWTELPLQAERVLWRTKGFTFRAGLSFNPGVSLLNRATTVNPYTAQSGSYWQYMLGRRPDTSSAVLESGEDLQRFRMGNGLSLGISGQQGNMGWGINVNTRYYYTDIWRSKYVPWQQRNLSYGLQFRLDWRF